MSTVNLRPSEPASEPRTEGVVLAVYAPFGTDETLTNYPSGVLHDLVQHPLVKSLLKVADSGITVSALIDLVDHDTYLVDIPADRPGELRVTSRWKQDMDSPRTLADFLQHAHALQPQAAVVLAMEGHGAGFLPDIDRTKVTFDNFTARGAVEWRAGQGLSTPFIAKSGKPLLESGAPVLPIPSEVLPTNHLALSTWGLGAALKAALEGGVPRISAIHFNNCFNMSVEVLHTVAPYADYATGYCNYNFFTSGEAYPAVFQKLKQAGTASPEQLAQWFADANHAMLAAKHHHPTVAGVVKLARMHGIVELIDDLSDALLSALRSASPAARPGVVAKIQQAIVSAQQYDTRVGFALETPDELTDIDSFANRLQQQDFGPHGVKEAALALQQALAGIKRYGDDASPWMDPSVTFDFSEPTLAMNIFLPDPLREGLWDWRSQYYLDVNPDPAKPLVQPNIIEFVKVTDWVDFIIEYHKDTKFRGLLAPAIPDFPAFRPHYDPPPPRACAPKPRAGDVPKSDDRPEGQRRA